MTNILNSNEINNLVKEIFERKYIDIKTDYDLVCQLNPITISRDTDGYYMFEDDDDLGVHFAFISGLEMSKTDKIINKFRLQYSDVYTRKTEEEIIRDLKNIKIV